MKNRLNWRRSITIGHYGFDCQWVSTRPVPWLYLIWARSSFNSLCLQWVDDCLHINPHKQCSWKINREAKINYRLHSRRRRQHYWLWLICVSSFVSLPSRSEWLCKDTITNNCTAIGWDSFLSTGTERPHLRRVGYCLQMKWLKF
jgi:hypothetical protein